MALIFPRLAQNFVRNGYFPTDEETLRRICSALELLDPDAGARLYDPCCGEGCALHWVASNLDTHHDTRTTATYGVEFDKGRAWHAKELLSFGIHADVHDVFVSARSMGLLFLNPPYGAVVADKGHTGDRHYDRLEKVFYQAAVPSLTFGGVLVLIVPHYVMDKQFATMISRNFEGVQAYLAPEQEFRQLVVLGIKRRSESPDPETVKRLVDIGQGQLPMELPQEWTTAPYLIPHVPGEPAFISTKIDAEQLQLELQRVEASTLWPQFDRVFSTGQLAHRRPLCNLSDWHLALALAAGQISGVVEGDDGTKLLIRGDTIKVKDQEVQIEEAGNGDIRTTILMRDKLVPTIVGIDFTPGPTLGRLVNIR